MIQGVVRIMVGSAIAAGLIETCVNVQAITVSEAFALVIPAGILLGLFEVWLMQGEKK